MSRSGCQAGTQFPVGLVDHQLRRGYKRDVDEELVRTRLEDLRAELQRRSVRNPSSARSSSNRRTIDAELEDVDRAMRMLEKGTYGICEACGRPIPPERLEAHPAARYCLEDQKNLEH